MCTDMNSPTPLDDVFRTEGEKMREWFIPIINEAYGTSYEVHQAVVFLHVNEQMWEKAVDTDNVNQKGILAVRNARFDVETGDWNVYLPRQVILYLRRSEEREPVNVNYRYDDQQIRVQIPCIPVQKYSMEDLFSKKLYLFIPYYMMRYEKLFNVGEGLGNEQIRLDLGKLNQRLYDLYMNGGISGTYVRYLAELSQTVMKHITPKVKQDERERLVKCMGGTVLELETDRILEEGISIGEKRGEQRGEQRGKLIGRVLMMKEEGYSVSKIAERVHITTEEVEEIMNTEEF